jgi:hypothetical protein
LRKLLLVALAIMFATTAWVETAQAKSRATCTRLVKAKEQYLTPGGRCGEECRAAIDLCVKGRKI